MSKIPMVRCLSFLVLLIAFTLSKRGFTQSRYTVVDLGTLGGSASYATAINSNGTVVGYSKITGNSAEHAFKYDDRIRDLGTLGGSRSRAYGINNAGVIVGWAGRAAGSSHAFRFDSSGMRDLGTRFQDRGISLSDDYSGASCINNSGQIAGVTDAFASAPSPGEGLSVPHAAKYENSTRWTDLGVFNYAMYNVEASFSYAINDQGTIVGMTTTADDITFFAFKYSNGVMSLIPLPGEESQANAINNSGTIVGVSDFGPWPTFHAFRYDSTGVRDLQTLGGSFSEAYSINSAGIIVGYSDGPVGVERHAFVYEGETMKDLNTLIPANTGWILKEATAINDAGWICGNGTINGQTHAFLLKPQSIIWGARVKVHFADGTARPDFLVACQSINAYDPTDQRELIFQSDLSINPATNEVTVLRTVALQSVQSIEVLRNEYDAANPDGGPTSNGLNAYNTKIYRNGTLTKNLVGFENGAWTFNNTSYSASSYLYFYAIPRIRGINLSAQAVKADVLANCNHYSIPPHIMYGQIWQESLWQQFDRDGLTKLNSTLDGGLGMLQLTRDSTLFDSNPLYDGHHHDFPLANTITHYYKLAADERYNLTGGFRTMIQKRLQTSSCSGDNSSFSYIENWYYTVRQWNGIGDDALRHVTAVWNWIRTAPYNRLDGISPVETVLASKPSGEGKVPTPFPAHADVNFDGVIDLELRQPVLTEDRTKGSLKLIVPAVPMNGSSISTGEIVVLNSSDQTVADILNLFNDSRLSYSIGGVLPSLSPGGYTAHISVTLSSGSAYGATYAFYVR